MLHLNGKNEKLWNTNGDELISFTTDEAERIKLFHKESIISTKIIKTENAYKSRILLFL